MLKGLEGFDMKKYTKDIKTQRIIQRTDKRK